MEKMDKGMDAALWMNGPACGGLTPAAVGRGACVFCRFLVLLFLDVCGQIST